MLGMKNTHTVRTGVRFPLGCDSGTRSGREAWIVSRDYFREASWSCTGAAIDGPSLRLLTARLGTN